MSAKYHGINIFDRTAQFHSHKGGESGSVQYPAHADHSAGVETRLHEGYMGHYIKRISNYNNNGVGCIFLDVLADLAYYITVGLYKIVPAHSRLSGNSGCYYNNVGILHILVIIGPYHIHIKTNNWC